MKRMIIALVLIAILAGTIPVAAQAASCPTTRAPLLKAKRTNTALKCWYANDIGASFPVLDFCDGNAPAGMAATNAKATSSRVKCVWKVQPNIRRDGWRSINAALSHIDIRNEGGAA